MPVLCPSGFFKDGSRQVEVLQPVASRGDGEEVRADLREEVARDWHPAGLGQGCRAQLANDAADLHDVWHREVRGPGLQAFGHVMRPHQLSPSWIGVPASREIRACSAKSSARVSDVNWAAMMTTRRNLRLDSQLLPFVEMIW